MTYTSILLTAALLQAAPAEAADEAGVRVLLVTGVDYKGHRWQETAPVVRQLLLQDPRFDVRTVEDPGFLAFKEIFDYDVLVMHFKNYDPVPKEEQVRQNLQRFVAQGKGLVLLHFALGAFENWPEFEQLAGRVWDKKLRGHDPRGPFTVKVADRDHPITQGMKDFQADDELYTCLGGDRPIHVLTTATSKVDGKDYPIAFVLSHGQGRVFHTTLGHDVRAIQLPGPADLLRRGTAWAAGVEPKALK